MYDTQAANQSLTDVDLRDTYISVHAAAKVTEPTIVIVVVHGGTAFS